MKQRLLFLGLVLMLLGVGIDGWGQIYFHDFGTTSITTKPFTGTPTTFDPNLSTSSWTTSASAFGGLAGNGGGTSASLSLSNSSGTPTFTLTFNVSSGYQVAITSFNFWRVRSSSGAQNWSMTINGTSVGSGTIPTTGALLGQTNVSNTISGLTGTITVVYTMSGASGTGTCRLDDFTLIGAVTLLNDITPPTWTSNYPKAENANTIGFTSKVNINEPGTAYFVVLPNNADAPTSAQVKAGQDATGSSLANNQKGTIACAAASTEYTSAVTGLSSSTNYDVYFVAQDDESTPNLQASPTKVDVATTASEVPVISTSGSLTSFTAISGTPSVSQNYDVSGDYLTGNVTVTAPAKYEVSTNNVDFSSSVELAQSGGNLTGEPVTIYVRIAGAAAAGDASGNIVHTSAGADAVNVAVTGTVYKPEPTNFPTSFSATVNSSSQITVTWTDASVGQTPDGYLIKATIDPSTPTAPSDGTAESDATLVKNIAQGTGTAVFTGLTASTTYNFSIWPYTNSGTSIDYKTGSQPTTSQITNEQEWVEDFETGTKASYTAGDVTCTKGSWNFAEAVIGNLANDRKNGTQSVRMRYTSASAFGELTMNFNKSNGAGTITIYHAKYGTDIDGSWKLQMSINDGTNWNDVGNVINTTSTSLTQQIFIVNQSGNVRFKIIQLSGNRINIEDITITNYNPPSSTTFNGNTSNSWELALNWDNGSPAATSNVTIASSESAIINSTNLQCNNLTLESSSTLTINTGTSLSVSGTLTNSAGASGLVIESDATGTGSLIHSTAGVAATVERYIASHGSVATDGWHLIGSPVATFNIDGSSFDPGANDDIYAWNEATNTWLNHKAGDPTQIVAGTGYIVAYENTATKNFSGNLNVADVSVSGLAHTAAQGKGWHLLGNPFASALEWNKTGGSWALTNVAGTAKVWNSTTKAYVDLSANGIIPAAQGFFVQVNEGTTGSLTIPAAARAHSSTAWYKNTAPRLILSASPIDGSSSQESQILIENEATNNFDFYYDARFLAGYAPQFYSLCGGEMLSTNVLSEVQNESSIPFGFVKNQHENFVIRLEENNLGQNVYLKDLKHNLTHNLSQETEYYFSSTDGDNPNRFLLHFGAVGISEQPTSATLKAYVVGGQLYFPLQGEATLEIVDLQGRVLQQSKVIGQGLASQPLQLTAGAYVVRLTSGQNAQTAKVIVK